MQQVAEFERMLEGWMKDLPHLPKEFSKWLAQQAWWLVIIGVVFGAFAILSTMSAILVGSALVGAVVGAGVGSMLFASSVVSMVGGAASLVLEALAVTPLKAMQKRGWDLLFLSVGVALLGAIVANVINVSVFGLVFSVVGAAIGWYVLFEVKSYFHAGIKVAKER